MKIFFYFDRLHKIDPATVSIIPIKIRTKFFLPFISLYNSPIIKATAQGPQFTTGNVIS